MAKTFLEKMEARKVEIDQLRSQVQGEIQTAQARLEEISSEKDNALRSQDREKYLQLCAEQDHLNEYIENSKEYMNGLTVNMPYDELLPEWKVRKSEFDSVIKKIDEKIMKLSGELVELFQSADSAREILNLDSGRFAGLLLDSDRARNLNFGVVGRMDVNHLTPLYQYLIKLNLITPEGQRVKQ